MLLSLCFLFVLFGIWIVAYIKKYTLLSLISGAFWFLWAMYEYNLSAGWDTHRGFAMLAGLFALLSWVLPYLWRGGDVDIQEDEPESGIDRYMRRRKKVKDAARKISGGSDGWEE